MIRTDGRPTIANAPALPPELDTAALEAEFAEYATPCTCTLACEPRGISEEQDCKESLSCLAETLVSNDTALD